MKFSYDIRTLNTSTRGGSFRVILANCQCHSMDFGAGIIEKGVQPLIKGESRRQQIRLACLEWWRKSVRFWLFLEKENGPLDLYPSAMVQVFR